MKNSKGTRLPNNLIPRINLDLRKFSSKDREWEVLKFIEKRN